MKKNNRIVKMFRIWLKKPTAVILALVLLMVMAGCAEDNKARVDFMANGGTGSMEQILTDKDHTTVQLTANTFTRDGYEFTGWNTEPDGKGTSYSDGQTVQLNINNSLIIYAQWKEKNSGTEAQATPEATATSQTGGTAEPGGQIDATGPTPTPNTGSQAAIKATATSQTGTAVHIKPTWHEKITIPIYEDRPKYEEQPVYATQTKWNYSYQSATYSFVNPMEGESSEFSYDDEQAALTAAAVSGNDTLNRLNGRMNEWFRLMFPNTTETYDSSKLSFDITATSNEESTPKWKFSYTNLTYTYTLPADSFKSVTSGFDYDSEQDAKTAGATAAESAGGQWYKDAAFTIADPFQASAFTCSISASSTTNKVQTGTTKVQVGTEKVCVGEQVVQQEGWY